MSTADPGAVRTGSIRAVLSFMSLGFLGLPEGDNGDKETRR